MSRSLRPRRADVAPEAPASDQKATRTSKTPMGGQDYDPARRKQNRSGHRELKRSEGTTIEEIMTKMEWLKHTTRALRSAGRVAHEEARADRDEKVGESRRYDIKG
jgi:hypothetical protein